MHIYTAPLAEMQFLLERVLDVESEFAQWAAESDEVDIDIINQLLTQAARFASQVVLPLNSVADRLGCTYDAGSVRTPPGFKEAYRQYCELGWPSLSCSVQWGGQGMPRVVLAAVQEMIASASHAFQMFASINQCAHDCLSRAASEAIKTEWLPRLVDGSVLATMCMSEPQAGSDLGLLTTRAMEQADASYRLTGTKIFASGAEHDLTENILHLVLARIAGAPAGTRGLSLFIVPKWQANGQRNNAHCLGIEHKLGLHGSPTCVMNFDAAAGLLIGEPNRGLAAMFHMMNAARLSTGLQAIGLSESAYQQALAYAGERTQGRAPMPAGTDAQVPHADPIIKHPDVLRMLRLQQAYIVGGRALTYWTALLIDRSDRHADAAERAQAADAVSLLTPVVKGFLSENAQNCTALALQVHGGHGYVTETGIDQYGRDARITTIYEGTTGIQATDLLVRKILKSEASTLGNFVAMLRRTVETSDTWEAEYHPQKLFESALHRLLAATESIRQRSADDPQLPYRVACDYLRIFGHVIMAAMWLRIGAAASTTPGDSAKETLASAKFYFTHALPEIEQSLAIVDQSAAECG
jgi:alkylation response protein AidB-like acyl-CoA dehydrogenase